ncbi:MAG: helix-turn-helix domain-containing protein [Firmicutes bacterium]|nr:helix-turn-helix domain-containing protein [Bacillota bacterium]
MLGDNIRVLRKEKGFTQETFAQQLNVVRQTVSKWEKGLSVPDAEMLNTISEVLEVPVSTLLGSTLSEPEQKPATDGDAMNEIAKQLAILNGQLAGRTARRRKILRGILIGLLALFLIYFICIILFKTEKKQSRTLETVSIICQVDGEEYSYMVEYDQNFQITAAGGDNWIYAHALEGKNYDDANVLLAKIEDYVKDHGGTCQIVKEPNQE